MTFLTWLHLERFNQHSGITYGQVYMYIKSCRVLPDSGNVPTGRPLDIIRLSRIALIIPRIHRNMPLLIYFRLFTGTGLYVFSTYFSTWNTLIL